MNPIARAHELIRLCGELIAVLERENEVLKNRRLGEIAELHPEKATLTGLYEAQMRDVLQSRECSMPSNLRCGCSSSTPPIDSNHSHAKLRYLCVRRWKRTCASSVSSPTQSRKACQPQAVTRRAALPQAPRQLRPRSRSQSHSTSSFDQTSRDGSLNDVNHPRTPNRTKRYPGAANCAAGHGEQYRQR